MWCPPRFYTEAIVFPNFVNDLNNLIKFFHLLKRGTTWTHFKPSETCWNQISWRIWSQNRKFYKLTEIWYRGTSLYGYYDLFYFKLFSNVYFFKNYFHQLFSSIIFSHFSFSSQFFKLNKIWHWVTLLYACYNFNVNFIKILVTHIFLANLITKSDVVPIDWNLAFAYIINTICWLFSCSKYYGLIFLFFSNWRNYIVPLC